MPGIVRGGACKGRTEGKAKRRVESQARAEEAAALAKKMEKTKFKLKDFRTQMHRMRKMGSLESILFSARKKSRARGLRNAALGIQGA